MKQSRIQFTLFSHLHFTHELRNKLVREQTNLDLLNKNTKRMHMFCERVTWIGSGRKWAKSNEWIR